MRIPFTKMQGAGNDYVYVDARKVVPPRLPSLARKISDRNFGVGGDGLILIRKSRLKGAKHRMQMFNADGSEGEMCGNGLRCVAKFLYDRKLERSEVFPVETGAGLLTVRVMPEKGKHIAKRVEVNMGRPRLTRGEIPMTGRSDEQCVGRTLKVGSRSFKVTCIGMGNPHCVIFTDEPPGDDLVLGFGPKIERHEWFPNRTNVEFVWQESKGVLVQRTFERGSGETLACGTGAAAVCVAANLNGLTPRKVKIKLRGGELSMYWNAKDDCVYKTGPAVEVFSGVWEG